MKEQFRDRINNQDYLIGILKDKARNNWGRTRVENIMNENFSRIEDRAEP